MVEFVFHLSASVMARVIAAAYTVAMEEVLIVAAATSFSLLLTTAVYVCDPAVVVPQGQAGVCIVHVKISAMVAKLPSTSVVSRTVEDWVHVTWCRCHVYLRAYSWRE
ncbi:hypothetical protein MRX96_034604 [Rhipicephalus microplus]